MRPTSNLVSLIKAQDGLCKISTTNLAHADEEGYVRKDAAVIPLGASSSGLGGVTLSPVYNTVDPSLQDQTRRNNSLLSKNQVVDKIYQELNVMFGSKGGKTSFSHELGRFTASLHEIAAQPDFSTKNQSINNAIAFTRNISTMAQKVNTLRGETDQLVGQAVDKINDLVTRITQANKVITKFYVENKIPSPLMPGYIDTKQASPVIPGYMDITQFETDRAQLVHELASLIEINVTTTVDNKLNISMADSGGVLIQGVYNYQLEYTPSTAVDPGDSLSPLTYLGTDIAGRIKSGQLGGLLQLRDKDLVRAQAEFDELTRVVRDTVNALHNQGASLMGSSSLTGTPSAPGMAGVVMDGTTGISGEGTLRLAVIDNVGTILDYKDVPLTNNMTINSLMTAVNSTNYTIGGSTTAASGGTILLEQLPSGALKLSSTDGNTIAIGGVNSALVPKVSLGTSYDSATGLGFSHFFGLNNIFETGTKLASSTAQIGIANQLKVRADLTTNGSYLSVGSLNSDPVIATTPGGALGNRKTDIATAINKELTTANLSFLAAGDLPAIKINAQNYSNQLMGLLQGKISQATHDLKASKTIYDQIATLAAEKSAVNVSEEFLKVYQIKTSQQIAAKALKLTLEMKQDIANII